MKIEIRHRYTNEVICSGEFESFRQAVYENKKNLSGSDLSGSDLSGSDLSGSDLRDSDLRGSDLRGSNLRDSDLRGSDLSGSNLRDSDLRDSDLRGSNISGSDLRGSNLSGTKNLLSAIDYINDTFEKTEQGIIVYKSFHENYTPNKNWVIKEESILNEVCNFNRVDLCGCGINFGTKKYVEQNCENKVYKCLIKWEWLSGVCVPYSTDGKCRCERLQIISEVKK